MSDYVLIILIIAITIVIVLVVFRRQLSDFMFKADEKGVEARLRTHKPGVNDTSVEHTTGSGRRSRLSIAGNWQIGKKNKIEVSRREAKVDNNRQLGEDQEIIAQQEDEK